MKHGEWIEIRHRIGKGTLALFFFLLSLGACSEVTPPPTDPNGPGGTGPGTSKFEFNASDFYVDAVPPDKTAMYLHVDGDWTKPCRAEVGGGKKDLVCLLEGEELDFYAQGMAIRYSFPREQCVYGGYMPYFYYELPAGQGPTAVTLNVDISGTVTLGPPAPTGGTVGVTVSDGRPRCNADYTNLDGGKNCCFGEYILTTNTAQTPPNPIKTTVSLQKWGGKASNCLQGPAMDSQSKTSDGRPMSTLVIMNDKTVTKNYEIDAPMKKLFGNNVYVSNFFAAPYTFANAPTPIQGATGTPPGFPFYEFVCLDSAEDYIHRIRVMIRAWSSDAQFKQQGNAQQFGAEGIPFNDQQILDRWTWPDPSGAGTAGFGDNYPGLGN